MYTYIFRSLQQQLVYHKILRVNEGQQKNPHKEN
jgi:hypothetical protein